MDFNKEYTRDLKKLYNNINDPQIQEDRTQAAKYVAAFRKKWMNKPRRLDIPSVMKEALDDYNILLHHFPGATKDLLYYLLLYYTKGETSKLRKYYYEAAEYSQELAEVFSSFEDVVGKVVKRKGIPLIHDELLIPYRKFLHDALVYKTDYTLGDKYYNNMTLTGETMRQNRLTDVFSDESIQVGSKILTLDEANSALRTTTQTHRREDIYNKLQDTYMRHTQFAEQEMYATAYSKRQGDVLHHYTLVNDARAVETGIKASRLQEINAIISDRMDIAHSYYAYLAQVQQTDKLSVWDTKYIPYPHGKVQKYDFPTSMDIVGRSIRQYDPSAWKIIQKHFAQGRIDSHPRKNKTSGAFALPRGEKQGNYIFLNHTDDLVDVITAGHEFGHTIHFYLSNYHQSAINSFSIDTFACEIAAQLYELLVYYTLMHDADPQQAWFIKNKLVSDSLIDTIFRQNVHHNFEYDLHTAYRQEKFLGHREITDLYSKHRNKEYGSYVKKNSSYYDWVARGHLRTPFYMQFYSMSMLISLIIFRRIQEDKKYYAVFRNELLCAGSTRTIGDILKKMDINIYDDTIRTEGLHIVDDILDSLYQDAQQLGIVH